MELLRSISTNASSQCSIDTFEHTYKPLEIIGSGSFATVYKALNRKTGTQVALKVVDKSKSGKNIIQAAYSEAYLLQ